jgi:hypothetical protein
MDWVFGQVRDRHGVLVDWTEEEVEVSHSTFPFPLSTLFFSYHSTFHFIQYRASDGGYNTGRPLPVLPVTHYIRVANIAFQYQTTRIF